MNKGFLEKLLERIQRVDPGEVHNYLAELAREKGFLETIFNAILEGVIVTDPKGRVIYLNRAAGGFFGVAESAALGRPIAEVIRGLDWEEVTRGSEVVSRDLEVFYPENRLLNFYVVSLLSDDDQRVIEGRAIILRDITQTQKSTEETIESERFSAVTLLAAGVAHEIGNPLNSLDIHLQLIQRKLKGLPAKIKKSVEDSIMIARDEVARLDQIITQFLQAIRPQPVRPSLENLNRLIEESMAFLKEEIRNRDILVETQLDSAVPPLELDRDQIKQAFYNIVRNAFQAMNSGGILRIQTSATEAHVFVAFSDTGGGIPAEQISRIFEPYFTTKPSGSGLGLMIVRRIVRAHGGEVAIHSTEGKGVTVTLRFPRADRRVRFLESGD